MLIRQHKCYLKYKLFGFLSKLLASLMRNYYQKRTSGAPLYTLSKLYDVPVGFVNPFFRGTVLLYLRSPEVNCCSISDDLSYSCLLFTNYSVFRDSLQISIFFKYAKIAMIVIRLDFVKFIKHLRAILLALDNGFFCMCSIAMGP